MANSAILAIRIVGDASDAVQAFNTTQDASKRMEDGLNKASIAAGAALAAIGAAAWSAANAASEAEQAVGAVESVFGATSSAILAYAEDAAQAVGLSQQSYNSLASILGAQLKNMGFAGDELATQTDDLIRLGSDLAATFGGTTADAVAAVSSLMRGERDPIERYGVAIKAADVNARLAAQGLTGLEGEALRAAETQATLALLTEQTAAAQGQFGRETDTAAGQMQIANAEWENAVAKLGESLLPLLVLGAQLVSEFSTWVSENTDLVTTWGTIIAVAATSILAVNAGLKAYKTVQAIATAAQWAWNAAAAANPAGAIILGIVGGITALTGVLGIFGIEWDDVWKAAGDMVLGVMGWVYDLTGAIGELFGIEQPKNDATPIRDVGRKAYEAIGLGGDTITNIEITGTMLDPDALARQLKRVLGSHDARTRPGGGSKF